MRKKSKARMLLTVGIIVLVLIASIAVYVIITIPSSSSTSESFNLFGFGGDFSKTVSASEINNCKTYHYVEDVWTGQRAPGTSGYPNTEMLNAERYVTKASRASESILFNGNIYKSAKTMNSVSQRAYYNIYILEKTVKSGAWRKIVGLNYKDSSLVSYISSTGWKTFKSYPSDTKPQTIRVGTGSLTLTGYHNGALKIELVVEFKGKTTFQRVMAVDYAFLT